jgi:hypothetical protein
MKKLLILLFFLVPGIALAQPAPTPKNPPLSALQIEIWPEYDRPAALIILNGEIAQQVAMPATVTLRLPSASGGVHAVASASREDAPLINVEHTAKSAGDALLVSFQLANRFFHIEYYDALATQAPERRYTFVSPGDFAAAKSMVMVQEPANASDVSMEPAATTSAVGQNGLRYRSVELGALQAGKPVKVEVRYTKTDARTSSEILQAQAPASAPAGATKGAASGAPAWVYGALAAAAIIVAALGFIVWYERRSRPAAAVNPAPPPSPSAPRSTVRPAELKPRKKRRGK